MPKTAPSATSAYVDRISDAQLAAFVERGYLVLPSWIPGPDIARLKQEIDDWQNAGADDRYGPPSERAGRYSTLPVLGWFSPTISPSRPTSARRSVIRLS